MAVASKNGATILGGYQPDGSSERKRNVDSSATFLETWLRYLEESARPPVSISEAYAAFQSELAEQPEKGAVIPGASPLRKLRWGDKRRGMGKRGGLRVIYIHIPDLSVLFMLDVYGKDEADDLTGGEKKELKTLAKQLIEELRERKKRGNL